MRAGYAAGSGLCSDPQDVANADNASARRGVHKQPGVL